MLTNSGHETNYPSVAGRHSSFNRTMNVTWWDNIDNEVYEKDFLWCDASFRPGHNTANNQNLNNNVTSFTNETKTKELAAKILLYPNPSSSVVKLNLSSLNNSKSYVITLADITGKKMCTFTGGKGYLEQMGSTAISKLKSGIYIFNVMDDHREVISTHKIIRL